MIVRFSRGGAPRFLCATFALAWLWGCSSAPTQSELPLGIVMDGALEWFAGEQVRLSIDVHADSAQIALVHAPEGMYVEDAVLVWQTTTADTGAHTIVVEARAGERTARDSCLLRVRYASVDSCTALRILRPCAGDSFAVGDTIPITWAVNARRGIERGVRIMLQPGRDALWVTFNPAAGIDESDSAYYHGNVGVFRWAVTDSALAADFGFMVRMVSDSCRVRILADYDTNRCTGEEPLEIVGDEVFCIHGRERNPE